MRKKIKKTEYRATEHSEDKVRRRKINPNVQNLDSNEHVQA